jgi:acetyl esterase/lipase
LAVSSGSLGDDKPPRFAVPARSSRCPVFRRPIWTAGSAELFRDEIVDFASRIWADGGQAELHVWAGGYHAFDILAPDARVSRAARRARTSWVERRLVQLETLAPQ